MKVKKPNREVLKKAGYKLVPSHSYAYKKHDEEWVTGLRFLRQLFPRYHFVRTGKVWEFHLDLKHHLRKGGVVERGEILRQELRCIRSIGEHQV